MHKSLALNVLSSLVELDVLYWTLHALEILIENKK